MILTIDIGTTVLKCAVFNSQGELQVLLREHVHLHSDKNFKHYEVDPEAWIKCLIKITSRISPEYKKNIKTIIISGNGPTLLPVDKTDKILHPAITWMDHRCTQEAREKISKAKIKVDPGFFLSKALWIKINKPLIYEKTKYFLPCPEYMNFFLTGIAGTILPAIGFEKYYWSDKAISCLGLDKEKFPDFITTGDKIGRITKKASEILELSAAAIVIAGGPDFIMSLLGTGTVIPGRTCDRAGTSEGINYCSKSSLSDSPFICLPHISKGLYNISATLSTSGKALEWFCRNHNYNNFEKMYQDASEVKPGADGLLFLPSLAGERSLSNFAISTSGITRSNSPSSSIWNSKSKGSFIGLGINHSRREMARAVLESLAYAVKYIIYSMEEYNLNIQELRIAGNQSSYALLNKIKSDITEKNILVPEISDAELTGNACIALTSLGEFKDFTSAACSIVKIKKIYEPDLKHSSIYSELFNCFTESYKKLNNVFTSLENISKMNG